LASYTGTTAIAGNPGELLLAQEQLNRKSYVPTCINAIKTTVTMFYFYDKKMYVEQ